MKLSDIGTAGLVVHTNKKDYKYVTESDWRSKGTSVMTTPEVADLRRLQAAVAPIVSEGRSVTIFVNFDKLGGLSATGSSSPTGKSTGSSEWSILVNEGSNLVEVPSELFATLDPGSLGDAAVLVRRGAVVATIPKNSIPSGSFCVLINLAGIKI
jgi:hypothetical protein